MKMSPGIVLQTLLKARLYHILSDQLICEGNVFNARTSHYFSDAALICSLCSFCCDLSKIYRAPRDSLWYQGKENI